MILEIVTVPTFLLPIIILVNLALLALDFNFFPFGSFGSLDILTAKRKKIIINQEISLIDIATDFERVYLFTFN